MDGRRRPAQYLLDRTLRQSAVPRTQPRHLVRPQQQRVQPKSDCVARRLIAGGGKLQHVAADLVVAESALGSALCYRRHDAVVRVLEPPLRELESIAPQAVERLLEI